MIPTKIVVIGAGSAIFGLNTLAALMRSTRLRGSQLALVDRDEKTLRQVGRLAARLNHEWDSHMEVSTQTNHREALDEAEFVVQAIEVTPRETLWRSDFEIPLK
jgi:alpha-galactosidase